MDGMMRAIGVGRQTKEDTMTPELCRSTSRLVSSFPPVVGSPPGILLNPHRNGAQPLQTTESLHSPVYSSNSAASSRSSIVQPTTPPASDSPIRQQRPSLTISKQSSASSASARASSRGRSPTIASSNKDPLPSPAPSNRKIRFAPLPQIRQRSYSTGRNIAWDVIEGGDGDDLDSQSRGLVRRDATDPILTDSEDTEDDNAPDQQFSFFGSLERTRSREDAASVTSKILRPLSFGLVGKKKKTAGNLSSEDLSRTPSNDSELTRTSSTTSDRRNESLPRTGRTGIPIRQTQSWDPDDKSVTPTSRRARKRAQYPPVAQRSRRAVPQSRKPVEVTEEFVEWSGRQSLGSRSYGDDDDDDGSGMAWLKKRRAQREAEERARKEEEERERQEQVEVEEDQQATADLPPIDHKTLAALQVGASRRQSTTDTVTPTTATTPNPARTPTNPPSSPKSLLSATRPATIDSSLTPERSNSQTDTPMASQYDLNAVNVKQQPQKGVDSNVLSSSPKSLASESETEDDIDEDNDDDDDDDELARPDTDTESDLDDEDLAQEDMLTEQARKTAACAGAEKFVDSQHANKLMKVSRVG